MKIDIKIENNRKFALVAFLVDKDDFLQDITDIRSRIKLETIPFSFPQYPYPEANRLAGFYQKGQISLNGARELLEEFCKEVGLQNLYALDKKLGTAVLFAESLTKKHRKSRLYTPAILASILTGYIEEEDFLSTQMLELNPKFLEEELEKMASDKEIVTIQVTRESTKQEVQQVFDFIQKYYFKTKKTKSDDGLKNIYEHITEIKVPDTANNIRRDREWYWMYKIEVTNGRGAYKRIMDKWLEAHPKEEKTLVDLNIIEQAVSRYKKFLKADI